jgi:DNA polymerase III alpha subunit
MAFADGCCLPTPDGPGFSREQAARLWEQVIAFAGYGFNQGHATAYADVSYRSAYVKAHWPAEFLCARLADSGGFHHPAVYVAEAERLGIAVRPPHVNFSGEAFALTYEYDVDGERPVLWMGLGQVRDLRRASIRAIVAERSAAPFSGPADLLARVSLSPKEIDHLVRCGALDGLGASRAAMLGDSAAAGRAGASGRGGSAGQMSFGFMNVSTVQAETDADRVSWETEILGRPVSAHPLRLLEPRRGDVTLRRLSETAGRPATARAVRIPGWPGGAGFFAGDGDTFVIARPDKALAAGRARWPVWRPMRLSGRWLRDEWDGGWFQVEGYEML